MTYDPKTTIPGDFLVAFDNGPLDENPAWTNLSSLTGVTVARWEGDRGRPTDRDKTDVAEYTVYGFDFTGTLDPTNRTSPLWDGVKGRSKVNPCKPARIQLYNPVDATYYPRMTGHISNIRYVIAPTGEYATWAITVVDDLDILADAEVIPGKAGGGVGSSGGAVYLAQQVDDRVLAGLADAALSVGVLEWPASKISAYSGNVAVQKREYGVKSTILNVVDDACDAEFPGVAIRDCDRFGVFRFRGRLDRLNPTASQYMSVDQGGTATYGRRTWKVGDKAAKAADSTVIVMQTGDGGGDALAFDRSKDNLVNNALVTPANMKPSAVQGQVYSVFDNDPSILTEFGARSISFEDLIIDHGDEQPTNKTAAAECMDIGQYWAENHYLPENRPEAISFGPELSDGTYADAWELLTHLDLSDLFTLITTHPGGGGFNDDFFVERIHEECTPGTVPNIRTTVELSPRAHFSSFPGA